MTTHHWYYSSSILRRLRMTWRVVVLRDEWIFYCAKGDMDFPWWEVLQGFLSRSCGIEMVLFWRSRSYRDFSRRRNDVDFYGRGRYWGVSLPQLRDWRWCYFFWGEVLPGISLPHLRDRNDDIFVVRMLYRDFSCRRNDGNFSWRGRYCRDFSPALAGSKWRWCFAGSKWWNESMIENLLACFHIINHWWNNKYLQAPLKNCSAHSRSFSPSQVWSFLLICITSIT